MVRQTKPDRLRPAHDGFKQETLLTIALINLNYDTDFYDIWPSVIYKIKPCPYNLNILFHIKSVINYVRSNLKVSLCRDLTTHGKCLTNFHIKAMRILGYESN